MAHRDEAIPHLTGPHQPSRTYIELDADPAEALLKWLHNRLQNLSLGYSLPYVLRSDNASGLHRVSDVGR